MNYEKYELLIILNYEENRFFGFIIRPLRPTWLLHYESTTSSCFASYKPN